ncbi:hypothetical protein JCM8202v2_000722 [Rhodotorula sphaerocarpa]
MARSLLVLLSLTTLAALAAAADLQISTPPAIYQCQPASLPYTCPAAPCTIVARPSGQASQLMHSFGDVNDPSGKVGWQPVDQATGTSVTFWITDKTGNTISSAAMPVSEGSDSSCLNGAASASSSGSSAASPANAAAASAGASSSGNNPAAASTGSADSSASSAHSSSGSTPTAASTGADASP